MQKERQLKRKSTLEPRRLPTQQRAKEKTQRILDTTAKLLEQVGVDDLTTILIAKELNISVGSLYHYFPNKHSILFALGANWLEEMTSALEEMERVNIESLTLSNFTDDALKRMYQVYKQQRAILPLAQALCSIPELRDLDAKHDQLVIAKIVALYKRLGLNASQQELSRLGRSWLETMHSMMLVIVDQKNAAAKRTLNDLNRMLISLLEAYQ